MYIVKMCWYEEWNGAKWPFMSLLFDCIWNVYGNLLMRRATPPAHSKSLRVTQTPASAQLLELEWASVDPMVLFHWCGQLLSRLLPPQ